MMTERHIFYILGLILGLYKLSFLQYVVFIAFQCCMQSFNGNIYNFVIFFVSSAIEREHDLALLRYALQLMLVSCFENLYVEQLIIFIQ